MPKPNAIRCKINGRAVEFSSRSALAAALGVSRQAIGERVEDLEAAAPTVEGRPEVPAAALARDNHGRVTLRVTIPADLATQIEAHADEQERTRGWLLAALVARGWAALVAERGAAGIGTGRADAA